MRIDNGMKQIEIEIKCPMITMKSVAWGPEQKENFKSSQEAIRHAVQHSVNKDVLRNWLEGRTHLRIEVNFYLSSRRASMSDIDSLLSDLFNPLVEGACGARLEGKPIPQTKDSLFWECITKKIKIKNDNDEKTIIKISPIGGEMK